MSADRAVSPEKIRYLALLGRVRRREAHAPGSDQHQRGRTVRHLRDEGAAARHLDGQILGVHGEVVDVVLPVGAERQAVEAGDDRQAPDRGDAPEIAGGGARADVHLPRSEPPLDTVFGEHLDDQPLAAAVERRAVALVDHQPCRRRAGQRRREVLETGTADGCLSQGQNPRDAAARGRLLEAAQQRCDAVTGGRLGLGLRTGCGTEDRAHAERRAKAEGEHGRFLIRRSSRPFRRSGLRKRPVTRA